MVNRKFADVIRAALTIEELWAEVDRLRVALEALKPYAAHKAGCRSLRCFAVVRESDGLKCGEPLGWRHTSSHPTEPGECDEACGLTALLKEEA